MRIEARQTRLKGTKRRDPRSGGCGAFGGDAPVDKVAAALAGGTRAREKGAVLRDAARVVAAWDGATVGLGLGIGLGLGLGCGRGRGLGLGLGLGSGLGLARRRRHHRLAVSVGGLGPRGLAPLAWSGVRGEGEG